MTNRVFVYIKTAAPTVNDDTGDGYKVGDGWYDTTNDKIYKAIDVTAGAAVWHQISGASLTLTTPTIASFVNATHTHRGAAAGGSLTQIRSGVVGNPNSWYTNIRPQVFMFRTDAAITITRIHISGADSTPTSEIAGDLKFADDTFTGSFANATVIDVCDTTGGVFTATSSFDDATVPSGKYVYFQFDSAPHADFKDIYIEVYYTYD